VIPPTLDASRCADRSSSATRDPHSGLSVVDTRMI